MKIDNCRLQDSPKIEDPNNRQSSIVNSQSNDDFRLKIEDWKNGNGDPEQPSTTNIQSSIVNNQSSIVNRQSKAPMDFEKVVEEFEGDREFLMEVLNGFLENVRAQIETIRQAISDGDADAVRREAHSIKGSAANLTADELSRIAFELENIGKSGALEEGIGCLKRLEKEFYRLEGYVRNLAI